MREGRSCVCGKTGKKRSVYVNGVYCESLTVAAEYARDIVKRNVKAWEIQKLLNERKKIPGLTVSEKPPEKKSEPAVRQKGKPCQIIRYPLGESPLDMGIPRRWR